MSKQAKFSSAPQIPGFLTKTYEIFSLPEHQEYCCWGPKGDSIIIRKIEPFARIVLPKYFKHSNFQSFVRQLNMVKRTAAAPSDPRPFHTPRRFSSVYLYSSPPPPPSRPLSLSLSPSFTVRLPQDTTGPQPRRVPPPALPHQPAGPARPHSAQGAQQVGRIRQDSPQEEPRPLQQGRRRRGRRR